MEKKKIGRPKILNNTNKKYIIYVDLETYSFYKSKGNGSVSRGMKLVQSALMPLVKEKII
jgi:hypothetical protein